MTRAPGPAARSLRALVVDDSAATRDGVAAILADDPAVEVVGSAADGEAALALALRERPDVVLLDLHMPRMDGFTFLRLLMAQRPTPVIVLSSSRERTDVFKALELGALDFVVKPGAGGLAGARAELLAKLGIVRALRVRALAGAPPERDAPALRPRTVEAARVAVVGASTGGPQALQHLLAGLPGDLPLAILVAQHMPERFTRPFAERLARVTRFSVQEASDGDVVAAGRVLVAPGGRHLLVKREPFRGAPLRVAVEAPEPAPPAVPRHVPSIDRLFRSAAAALGPRACGVLLTGMGQDGAAGLAAIRAAGGLTLAESEETAVVYGMPQAAAEAGAVDELLRLELIAARLARFARSGP